jgi:hypothetical protein
MQFRIGKGRLRSRATCPSLSNTSAQCTSTILRVQEILTSIKVLPNPTLNTAAVASRHRLGLKPTTARAHAPLGLIHGLLQAIPLPAKHIVTMLSVARVVARGEVEGLRAVGGPVGLVVELPRVPHDLEHDLRNPDGMRGRAGAAGAGAGEGRGTVGWVGDVRFVVRAVEVLAVPAAGGGVRGLSAECGGAATYVGYRMLERMPPGQGFLGSSSVSSLMLS